MKPRVVTWSLDSDHDLGEHVYVVIEVDREDNYTLTMSPPNLEVIAGIEGREDAFTTAHELLEIIEKHLPYCESHRVEDYAKRNQFLLEVDQYCLEKWGIQPRYGVIKKMGEYAPTTTGGASGWVNVPKKTPPNTAPSLNLHGPNADRPDLAPAGTCYYATDSKAAYEMTANGKWHRLV